MWRDLSSISVQLTCRRAMTSLVSPLWTEMVLIVVVGARGCCCPPVGTSSTSMFISTSLIVRTVTLLRNYTSTLTADSTHTAAVRRAGRYLAPQSTVPKIHEGNCVTWYYVYNTDRSTVAARMRRELGWDEVKQVNCRMINPFSYVTA